MDKSTKITLVIAVLLLVILIIVTIMSMLGKMNAKTPYPVCPDYWNKIVMGGNSYCMDTRRCNGKRRGGCRPDLTYFDLNKNSFGGSDYNKCEWSKRYNHISWEGIDTLCTGNPKNVDYTYKGKRDIMRGIDGHGRRRKYTTTIYNKATPPPE